MGKIKKGAKGSTPLKIRIVSFGTAAAVLFIFAGVGIYKLIIDAKNKNFAKLPIDVPGIATPLGTGTATSFGSEDKADSTDNVQSQDNENLASNSLYNALLANLTDKAQEYCAEHRTSLSKMQMLGISNIKVQGNEVAVKGEFKNRDTFGNYIFAMQNENKDLDIFNINNSEFTPDEFVEAVNQILNDPSTSFTLDARQRLVDFSEIDKDAVVQNVVEGLSEEEATNLIDSVKSNSASFSLLLNDRVKTESGYTYSCTTVFNTADFIYASKFSFHSEDFLETSSLTNKIKHHIASTDATCTTVSVPTGRFEKILHQLKTQKISQASVQESEQATNIH